MFFNNRPDGPGSFYEATSGSLSEGSHAIWQAGRKIKELQTPFVPTIADLPDDNNQHLFSELLQKNLANTSDDGGSNFGSTGDLYDLGISSSRADVEEEESNAVVKANRLMDGGRKIRSFSIFDDDQFAQLVDKSQHWKVIIGKYIRLPLKDAKPLGIDIPADYMETQQEEEGAAELEEDEGEIDELTGYHFVECAPLFVAYVYVNSASKVFEDRLVNRGMVTEFPDFEAVHHLVIDAVDEYNEKWEFCFRQCQQSLIQQQMLIGQQGSKVPAYIQTAGQVHHFLPQTFTMAPVNSYDSTTIASVVSKGGNISNKASLVDKIPTIDTDTEALSSIDRAVDTPTAVDQGASVMNVETRRMLFMTEVTFSVPTRSCNNCIPL